MSAVRIACLSDDELNDPTGTSAESYCLPVPAMPPLSSCCAFACASGWSRNWPRGVFHVLTVFPSPTSCIRYPKSAGQRKRDHSPWRIPGPPRRSAWLESGLSSITVLQGDSSLVSVKQSRFRRQSHRTVQASLKGPPAEYNLQSERCVNVRK